VDRSAANPGGVELAPGVRVPEGVLRFSFVASSGPGGQNVNKRATKAELRLSLANLPIPADARERLLGMAGHLTTEGGELMIAADEHRSQARNREACLDRLRALLVAAMVRPRKRRRTRPTRSSVERRLASKRATAAQKRHRRDGGAE
jgi:ribosome-associated protein